MAKGNSGKGKGQKREDIERKRDDRNRRKVLKKERDIKEYLENDENFVSFKNQLEAIGLKIKDILGDGNCLFRALGDQLNGDHTAHAYHRRNTVQYIKKHREDFEPFMEDGLTFDKHIQELSKLGTYGGNDSIVAFARNNGVDIVIHQLNNPRWVIHGSEFSKMPEIIELHLAYHNGEHYSSVRRSSDPDNGPAWEYNKKNATQPKDKATGTNDVLSKRQKKKESKKTKPSQEAAVDESKADFSDSLEQIIMNATGCQDLKLINETLQENDFNVDLTIGYILQLMTVMEDQECATNCEPSDQGEMKDMTSSSTENDTNNVDRTDVSKTQETISTETTNKQCSDLEEKEIKESLNNFVDNLRESLTDSDKNKMQLKQGARPKENTKKNSTKPTAHLSNRQRKELAKQDKKKRRDERRKDDKKEKEHNSHCVSAAESKLDSLVADLGVVRI